MWTDPSAWHFTFALAPVGRPRTMYHCHRNAKLPRTIAWPTNGPSSTNVEAATATDDRRPTFQQMMERACDPDRPFNTIVFYSFNRFFRNGADMELAIRKLRKHGVEVVSVTQPTGDDHSRELMRQLIGVFDEHTSRRSARLDLFFGSVALREAGLAQWRSARSFERYPNSSSCLD